jgi:molybdate transport system ATP-binding protein
MITLQFELVQDGFTLRIDERVDGRVVAIVGPSGSGKTTVLEAIAGLRTPRAGRIAIGDRTLFSSADGIDLPARDRRVGYVPQDALLFPHMSVRRNILYGFHGAVGAGGAAPGNRPPVETVLAMLEIEALGDRPVTALSGGERQRVAVARAIMSGPLLLLLDEPLAAVDVPLRRRIVPSLERVRDELQVPMIYVTHDRGEAAAIADWTLALDAGRVVASGEVDSQ